jgi:hypothetical protein
MRKLVCLAACMMLAVYAIGAKGRDAFDGKWTVTVTAEDGGKTSEDTLTFAAGKVVSEFAKKHGFEPAEYEIDARGGAAGPATFTATSKSAKEGTIKWTGTATASSVSGTFTWTKADGEKSEYSYKGERAAK